MGKITTLPFDITAVAGAGSAISPAPISGYLIEMFTTVAGTALVTVGGTTDFIVTSNTRGGTLIDYANVASPFKAYPSRRLISDAGGTTAYALGIGPVVQAGIPVDDYVKVAVSSAVPAGRGTVFLSFEV